LGGDFSWDKDIWVAALAGGWDIRVVVLVGGEGTRDGEDTWVAISIGVGYIWVAILIEGWDIRVAGLAEDEHVGGSSR
jgi:hypothetical protein